MDLKRLKMTDMNGPQFLGEMRKAHATVPVVIVTGYPDSELMLHAIKYAQVVMLVKPVEAELLERTVRTAVVGRRSSVMAPGKMGEDP